MENYKIVIKPSAVKELEKIPKKDRIRIAEKISALAINPRPTGCQKLSGQNRYRIRHGVYRVVYGIDDVIKIGSSEEFVGQRRLREMSELVK